MNQPLASDNPVVNEVLSQLRDYRLPEPVDWWPIAPGWWALLALLLVAVAMLLAWWRRRRVRHAAARQAMYELDALSRRYASERDVTAYLRRLSALLRRFVLVNWPRSKVAGLTGDAWLEFLDEHGGNGRFTDGPGRHLLDAPYRKSSDVPAEQVAELVRQWVRGNREAKA